MTWQKKDFDQILGTLRSRVSPRLTDFEPGSVVRTLFESFAYELAVLYEEMEQVYDASFIDTASGTDLDKVVAILGIQRGEPEFATGTVTFERDIGIEAAIDIPIDTLVTTEDAENSGGAVKKAYRTLEVATLQPDQPSLTVKIKAEVPGDAGEAAAHTIVVMPQPIQGVKAVSNPEAIVFTGKRAETDIELRDRAKQTLLASSGSNTTAIEKALLSLPGVRAVKISEVRDPEGQVLPGRLAIVVDRDNFDEPELQGTIERVRAAGIFHTLKQPQPYSIQGIFQLELQDETQLSPEQTTEILTAVRSAISDYVTSLTMSEPLVVAQLTRHILNVPGVKNLTRFALIDPHVDATPGAAPPPKIPEQPPTADYRLDLDMRLANSKGNEVRIAIFLDWSSLNEPSADKVAEFEKAFAQRLQTQLRENSSLSSYLTGDSVTQPVVMQEDQIRGLAQAAAGQAINENLDGSTTVITPDSGLENIGVRVQQQSKATDGSWQPTSHERSHPNELRLDFLDRVTALTTGVAYASSLSIGGGIQLALDPQGQESATITDKARERIHCYLESLAPAADVEIPKLVETIEALDGVERVIYEPKDFLVTRSSEQPVSSTDQTIEVRRYEKPQLASGFRINTRSEPVTITLSRLRLRVRVSWPLDWLAQAQLNARLEAAASLTQAFETLTEALGLARQATSPKASEADALKARARRLIGQARTQLTAVAAGETADSLRSSLSQLDNFLESNSASAAELDIVQLPPLPLPYYPNAFSDTAKITATEATRDQISGELQQHRAAAQTALQNSSRAVVRSLFSAQSGGISIAWGLPPLPPGQDLDIDQIKAALVEQFGVAVSKLDSDAIIRIISSQEPLTIDQGLLATAANLALLNATVTIADDDDNRPGLTLSSSTADSAQPVTYIRSTQVAQFAPIDLAPAALEIEFSEQITLS